MTVFLTQCCHNYELAEMIFLPFVFSFLFFSFFLPPLMIVLYRRDFSTQQVFALFCITDK